TITIVWITPQSPILSVNANDTSPYITQWSNITVICQSGTGNVHTFWYYNPLDLQNHTLATNFAGVQIRYIINTSAVAGSYTYKFWANSTYGVMSYDSFTIIWVTPQGPILTVITNATSLYISQWTNITVTCQSGTGNVNTFWYYNPFDLQNHTLATNFAGIQTRSIINMSMIAGVYTYKFWANSTYGVVTYEGIIIIWILPQPPILSVITNVTSLYITQWVNLTVICQSGTGNVDTFWYYNPLSDENITLATNFMGVQILNIINTSAVAGSYTYRFWANSTYGLEAYESVTIVWVTPQPPILTANANTTSPYINQWTNLTVICQSGSGNVDIFWYYNPLSDENITLGTDFAGIQISSIINTSAVAGSYTYKFWANSTFGLLAYETFTIFWTIPQAPLLTVSANTTSPYINQWTNLTVICQSGSGNVDTLWYYNPLSDENITIANDFAGIQIRYIINTSAVAGSYIYQFWANSTFGVVSYDSITVVWVIPQAPIITAITNATSPYINQWTNITVICQSGSEDVDTFWYYNPLSDENITLATAFEGLQIRIIIDMSVVAGSYTYQFWANSTSGVGVHESLTIFWLDLQPPILNIISNNTNPLINEGSQLVVTCQSGAGNISVLWYYNSIAGQNETLDINFAGSRIYYLNFTTDIANSHIFHFWANSTFGLMTYTSIPVVWTDPQPPIINLLANTTYLYITKIINITVTCQSGTGNVDTFWYYNPLNDKNMTLAADFAGIQISFIINTTGVAGSYKYEFWANSTYGVEIYNYIIIVWLAPTPPSISLSIDTPSVEIDERVLITVIVRMGTGNVDHVWFYDPIEMINKTIDSNFIGERTYYLNFTSSTAGSFDFIFWANSSYGIEVYDDITVVWIEPSEPIKFWWLIWLLLGILGAVAAIVSSYMLYFKVPKTIRTIRKTKAKIRKGKELEPIKVPPRDIIVDSTFTKIMKTKKLPSKKPEAPHVKVRKKKD
ncbi:MAG: hypothetical protein ACFFD2_14540, partial [Promethearchaeota archaeon]